MTDTSLSSRKYRTIGYVFLRPGWPENDFEVMKMEYMEKEHPRTEKYIGEIDAYKQ